MLTLLARRNLTPRKIRNTKLNTSIKDFTSRALKNEEKPVNEIVQ